MKVNIKAEKIDKVIFKIMYAVSICAGLALMIAAVLCSVDSISTKVFSWSVPNGTEWVTYLNIPIVFLAMGYIQVERGNTVVDLVSNKFPKALNKFVQILGCLLGVGISVFLMYCEYTLMVTKFSSGTRASAAAGSFVVWPFALIITLGYLLVAVAFLWSIFRILLIAPERRMGALVPPAAEQDDRNKKDKNERGTKS